MASHSSILAWRISWTEEPGRLQSTGSQSQTRLSDFTSLHKNIINTGLGDFTSVIVYNKDKMGT